MRCGEKCFVVEYEADGISKTKQVNARTPVEVRKKVRSNLGRQVEIRSVRKK